MVVKKNNQSSIEKEKKPKTTKRQKRSKAPKEKVEKLSHIDPNVIVEIGKELNEYTASIKNDEIRKAKGKFMDLYQKVEFAYKKLLIEYKIKVEGCKPVPGCKSNKERFNPDRLNIVDSQVEKVFEFAGISLNKKLFCNDDEFEKEGQKSCRKLRDEITHSSSKKAIKEVFERQCDPGFKMRKTSRTNQAVHLKTRTILPKYITSTGAPFYFFYN